LFRDWDDFAAAGESLALIAAWLIAETLRAAPRAGGLAVAVALGAAVPAVQWLAHHADLERGLARVEAFMREPPERTANERGKTWDFLGIRNFRLARWDAAVAALARAAETAPSPRILLEWATAETQRGDLEAAQRVYEQLVARSPDDVRAWRALTAVAVRRGDRIGARRAVEGLLRARPGDSYALRIRAQLDADRAP
jgi:tetratricopeptide (TPR) repeat protein